MKTRKRRKYAAWERLIKIDYEEADIVMHIAEKKEEEGNIPEAIEYYKKAIYRFINKKLFTQVRDIWHKLLESLSRGYRHLLSY